MSLIKPEQFRAYARIIHTADDALIQDLIDGAEDECLQYLDRQYLPRRNETAVDECAPSPDSNDFVSDGTPGAVSDSDDLAPAVRMGCYLIIQGGYDAVSADEMTKLRKAAEVKWHPYRNGLGV